MITLDEYQEAAIRTRNNELPKVVQLATLGLGLGGESGECADLIKKHVGHGHPLDEAKLVKELGDVLWYIATLADELGVSLSEVAERNVAKLKERYPEGFEQGRSLNRKEEA